MPSNALSRREFVRLSALAAAGLLVASCGSPPGGSLACKAGGCDSASDAKNEGGPEMSQTDCPESIPMDVALQLCAEIRQEVLGRWWTFAGLQCWGCTKASKGDPAKSCVGSRSDGRGCNLVNARFDRQRLVSVQGVVR